jgi:hypothetical protein
LDVLGAVLGTGGLVALIYGSDKAGSWGWHDPWRMGLPGDWGWNDSRSLGLFAGGVLLLAAFLWWQTKASSPLLPPYVFKDRGRLGAFLTMVLAGMGLVVLFLTQIFYLHEVLDYALPTAGVYLLPTVAAMVIGSTQISARLLHRVQPRTLTVPGLALVALGVLLLTGLEFPVTYTTEVLPSLLLTGLGTGMVLMPLFAIATAGSTVHDSGVTAATVSSAQQLGSSIGSAAFSGILGSFAGVTMSGYTSSLWFAVGILLLAGLVAGLLSPSIRPATGPTPIDGRPDLR